MVTVVVALVLAVVGVILAWPIEPFIGALTPLDSFLSVIRPASSSCSCRRRCSSSAHSCRRSDRGELRCAG